MKKFILGFLLLLLIAAPSTAFAQGKIKEILVAGIRMDAKQFKKDPQPASSEYLVTRMAGFYVSEYGARYYCAMDIIKDRPKTIYVRMELPNPANPKDPVIVQEGAIDPRGQTLNVAFGPIKNLKMKGVYKINVTLFEDEAKTIVIDRLTQSIKSYVDTRGEHILINDNQLTTTGQKISEAIKTLNPKE